MATAANKPNPTEGAKLRLLLVKLKHIGDALLLTPTFAGSRSEPKSAGRGKPPLGIAPLAGCAP